jgi:hypothetical protein
MMEMVRQIKEKSFSKKDLLTESEFRTIADSVLNEAAKAS